jgi:hypothetical protein
LADAPGLKINSKFTSDGVKMNVDDIVGNDETGEPLVSRYVATYHWAAIKAYRIRRPVVPG